MKELTPIQKKAADRYPRYEDFMKEYHPKQLGIMYQNVCSIEDAASRARLTLEDIYTLYSTDQRHAGIMYINEWLIFLNEFLNINKPLVNTMAVAVMIYPNYKHLYLSDVKVLFEQLVHGLYGTFYGSVDAQRILYAFMQYNLQRQVIQNRELQKYEKKLKKLEEDAREACKKEIYDKIKSTPGITKGELWQKYEQECHKELPRMIAERVTQLLEEENKEN